MNAARILPRIDQMIDELKSLREVVASEQSSEPEPTRLSVEEYAKHSNVAVGTVRRWLDQGMPCVRRGRSIRIKVAEADAWTPSDTVSASAKKAAHRGGR